MASTVRSRFAAFIMTYERPIHLKATIEAILRQSMPPERILVVDNGASDDTAKVVRDFNDSTIVHYRVGHNSGPAGAAFIGLKTLASDGYDWIYWGDDDDPPKSDDDFKNLFNVLDRAAGAFHPIGIVGRGAGRFKTGTGRTLSYPNAELKEGLMEGDFVPGNNVSIFNGEMVRKGILPRPELFFGFEELDYCMRVRRAGYHLVFDAEAVLKTRRATGRGAHDYRWKGRSIGRPEQLWRQYYSTRNMLFVLRSNRLWGALIYTFGKSFFKAIYGLRYGLNYGVRNFRIQTRALFDFVFNRTGMANLTSIVGNPSPKKAKQ
jgi:GT2 family glycosyltransferase